VFARFKNLVFGISGEHSSPLHYGVRNAEYSIPYNYQRLCYCSINGRAWKPALQIQVYWFDV